MMPLIKQFGHLQIQLDAIKSATNNFSDDSCIGKGGFGSVYKGELILSKGKSMVAIKRLDRAFGQGDPEFWKEIIMLSVYRHENIVSLLGFCDETAEKILVYEYASRRSLDLYLNSDDLNWVRRLEICLGAARGLAYLHSSVGTHQRVLHRDIKSSNILLDENWNARISDLGLAKFGPADQQYTFLVSNAVGTIGYCDPLYVETGLLTKESDVYSFGVVLFEVLCGRLCILNDKDKRRPLTGLVRQFYEQKKIDELIHDNIKHEIHPNSMKTFTAIAYRCLNKNREARPLMTEIVRMLEAALEYQGVEKHEQPKRTYSTATNMLFHFIRGDRQQFTMEDLLGAEAEVISGRKGLGTSYKAEISEQLVVFVKRFKSFIIEEKLEFHAHMMVMGSLSHPNLLPYIACYYNNDDRVLVTDFINNGSLASHLHDEQNDDEPGLDWTTRLKIIKGVACGLGYLYREFSHLSLPHGHLKSSSVLLDDAFNPLLTDYAFSPIIKKEQAQKLMVGYKSPEFYHHEQTTTKTDVWCLGILILEIMTGQVPNYLEQGKGKKPSDMAKDVNSIIKDEWIQEVFDKIIKLEKNRENSVIEQGKEEKSNDIKTRVNSTSREEWIQDVFDNFIKWEKNNENQVIEKGRGEKSDDMETWLNSIRREEWSQKVFDKNMKWEKTNEIEMVDLLEIGLHCCEPDVSRRWSMRKAIEKIQGLKESDEDDDHLYNANEVENSYGANENSK